MLPVPAPKHKTFVTVLDMLITAGCTILFEEIAEQPKPSVTVTLYVEAVSNALSSVVIPPPQLYVIGAVPPMTVISIAPLFPPKQDTLVTPEVSEIPEPICVTAIALETEQPVLSVTVTVYVPAIKPALF